MSSIPQPLLPATISLVLEYIAPPSLLSPLPPHLISSALAQRHRFLDISPDNPVQYLAWPTDARPDAQQVAIDLLESFQKQIDHPAYAVRYASDAESAFAHVAISSTDPPGIRLVFQWEPSDGWKFHNLSLMPFPLNTHESISDAVVLKPYEFLEEPPIAVVEDDERDTYWDAYGLSDEHDDHPGFTKAKADEAGTEDAYWAQYSAVHGSGDSTLPTPPTANKKLNDERVIVSYPGHRTLSAYNPLAPPSPTTLTYRLANISPRVASPLFADDSDSGSGSGSDASASLSLKTSPTSHPMTLSSSSIDYPSSLLSVDTPASSDNISPVVSSVIEAPPGGGDESREALKDAIRSIYRLWKAGRMISSPTSAEDGQEFLDIVREVVAESSLERAEVKMFMGLTHHFDNFEFTSTFNPQV
ncbi:hypothetical protein LshimejAT787_0304670 [Lyophyllum shimeji]|uniref:Uncharacterized protein n=1 Tax=Lyophyllum shimeji TaxID=47721 RepID=A0A9P3PIQ9_LYOSH|nr:hypothetical protein LshimejAT787_0304670 [Lyophyllum shimeji]